MVAVGVLLMFLAAVFVLGLVLAGGPVETIKFYGLVIPDVSARGLVLLGLITGLIFAIGAESVRWGITRWRQRKAEDEAKDRELAAARARLAREGLSVSDSDAGAPRSRTSEARATTRPITQARIPEPTEKPSVSDRPSVPERSGRPSPERVDRKSTPEPLVAEPVLEPEKEPATKTTKTTSARARKK